MKNLSHVNIGIVHKYVMNIHNLEFGRYSNLYTIVLEEFINPWSNNSIMDDLIELHTKGYLNSFYKELSKRTNEEQNNNLSKM